MGVASSQVDHRSWVLTDNTFNAVGEQSGKGATRHAGAICGSGSFEVITAVAGVGAVPPDQIVE
jgi:hypothetical protein